MQHEPIVRHLNRSAVLYLVLALGSAATLAYGEREGTGSPVAITGETALRIEMKAAGSEEREVIGVIRVSQRATGVVIEPALEGLTPGMHGLHIHEGDSCEAGATEESGRTAGSSVEPAKEAGEHWDPGIKGNHGGPWGHGHRGDLPNVFVDDSGTAETALYAPRVTTRDFQNRALVLHSKRDNYSDEPDSTGGTGRAIACGIAED